MVLLPLLLQMLPPCLPPSCPHTKKGTGTAVAFPTLPHSLSLSLPLSQQQQQLIFRFSCGKTTSLANENDSSGDGTVSRRLCWACCARGARVVVVVGGGGGAMTPTACTAEGDFPVCNCMLASSRANIKYLYYETRGGGRGVASGGTYFSIT